ncbi:oxidoreductase [Rubrivivax sp. JA1026]|uniref:oxidoreductase n=1 Tax=Rubrivivax sp. JA1026 TaxID=2710888 RepID=UPI0013E9785F|nr:oxidoreductase [Rubrivivax sp. JA1026]
MDDLKVGLIGWGSSATTFHAPLIRATPGLQLAAVATRSPTSAAAAVRAACGDAVTVQSAEALIADGRLDLIVVATPNDSHHALADAALRAGRHVVVDKPFALDTNQARSLVARAGEVDRLLCVFHNRRWDGDFMTLRSLLDRGVLGRPVEFVSHFDRYRPHVRDRWREHAGAGNGLWFDLGPHLLDQTLQLFGAPAAITLDLALQRDGALTDDWFCCHLRWEGGPHDGLRARLQAGMLAAEPGPRFLVHGHAGSLRIDGLDPQESALKRGADPADPGWGQESTRRGRWWLGDGPPDSVPLLAGAYPSFYAGMRDAIRGLGPLPVALDAALAVQALLDAGRRSVAARAELRLA